MKHLAAKNGVRADWLRPMALLLVGILLLLQASAASALIWTIQTVDATSGVGWFSSLALDSNGDPHISYYDFTSNDLKYAVWDNGQWNIQTVDGAVPPTDVGAYTSLVLDANNDPHISYYDVGNDDLKYAAWENGQWNIQLVDAAGDVGWSTSLALDAAGDPHISYTDATTTNDANLKYAVWKNGQWNTVTVDSQGDTGYQTSLEVDAAGTPHISYLNFSVGDLMYATIKNSAWVTEAADSTGTVGYHSSLELDTAGEPHISYWGLSTAALKYATLDGDTWLIQTVDNSNPVGQYSSLALDAAGNPRISYYDNHADDLRYATLDGGIWNKEVVDSNGDSGWHTSLALDAAGNPHISYYSFATNHMMYVTGSTPAKLTITKSVAGSGAPTFWGFIFGGDLGAFSLDDGSPSKVFSSVTPGTVAVTETNPNGYATTVACNDGTTSTSGELSITLAANDDVTCTFTNTICQPGSFDTDTTWACSEAQPGNYVEFHGSPSQTPCSPGYYQPASGQTACLQADPGYYATGPAATGQTACPAGTTSPPGSDSNDDCVSLAPDIYLSARTAGTTSDGLAFGPEDILKWDGSVWSTWFDGSDALLMPGNKKAKHNINAFWLPGGGDDDVVMAFAQNRRFVPDIAVPVDGMDLVGWDGVEFSFYFDGSDVGLDKKGPEKIDGLHSLDGSEWPINGDNCIDYLLISTVGPGKVPNYGGGTLKFGGEDVLGFCLTQFGLDTAGYWHLVVDGSAVGLPKNATNGLSMDDDGRTLYLTTNKAVDLGGGVAGGHSMIYAYDLIDGTFSGPHFSAAANGLTKQVTGLQVDGSLP